MVSKRISIMFHNYYGNDEFWFKQVSLLDPAVRALYYNTVEASAFRQLALDVEGTHGKPPGLNNMDYWLLKASNVGKDIGGKLLLVDAAARLSDTADFWLFFHDKMSPYHALGRLWSERQMRLLTKGFCEEAMKAFDRKSSTGIVCLKGSKEMVDPSSLLEILKYTVDSSVIEKINSSNRPLPYVAGTMFLARADLYRRFRWKLSPVEVRGLLEKGEVTDINKMTFTHAWERMWTWISTTQGYGIEEI